MKSNLVGYICRATVHIDATGKAQPPTGSPVTVYEGEWAYCPAGARTGHQWQSIQPVSLVELKLVGRPRELAPRTREATV